MATLAKNSRATFDYELKETLTAGLVLSGAEVKAAKSGNISLSGSYVNITPTGAFLVNCHIGPYKYAPSEGYEPTRTRKLLLNKKEINSLIGKEKGLTIVPVEVFIGKKGLIKITIAMAKARKKGDKREYIKKKELGRELRKTIDR